MATASKATPAKDNQNPQQEPATGADMPNADAVPPAEGDELVRIDPAQNIRPAMVARGGRHPMGTPESMSREELNDARQELEELRVRMSKLEQKIGTGVARRTFAMSEGVRQDIELHGVATDPATGETFTRDDLGRISERE